MKKTNYSNIAAIAVDKSLLKEYQTSYGRTVYLDKDSEFQIKLFNPYSFTVGAEIIINGKSLGDTLIIKPGQLIWLERYFNEARKFRFDVYEVDAQAEAVKQAIKNNGDIVIKFYKEKEHVRRGLDILAINTPVYNGYSKSIDTIPNWDNTVRCNTSDLTFGVNDMVNTTYTTNNVPDGALRCELSASSCNYSNSQPISQPASKGFGNLNLNKLRSATMDSATMETGRVEKGGYSDQRFMTVDIDLESWPFVTEEIKLLPKSQKPVYKEDLEKLYCPQCGRKVKTKFKYCPFCGGKLQEIF